MHATPSQRENPYVKKSMYLFLRNTFHELTLHTAMPSIQKRVPLEIRYFYFSLLFAYPASCASPSAISCKVPLTFCDTATRVVTMLILGTLRSASACLPFTPDTLSLHTHSCALSPNQTIKCWGANDYGQLGYGDYRARGDVGGEMGDRLPSVQLGKDFYPMKLSVGHAYSCALSTGYKVKCWGRNDYGQLGYGDTRHRGGEESDMGNNLPFVFLGNHFTPIDITAGYEHTCVLSLQHTIKCWGRNAQGALGYGDYHNRGDEAEEMGDTLPLVALGNGFTPILLSIGFRHTCALSTTQTIKCWGANDYGQLGYGDTQDRGKNAGEMGDSLSIVSLHHNFTPLDIRLGHTHTCALSTQHTIQCWGNNTYGQLGYGNTHTYGTASNETEDQLPLVNLGIDFHPVALVSGAQYNCALSTHQQIKCWGWNDHGQLGYGDTETRGDEDGEMGGSLPFLDLGSGFTPITLFLGTSHSCAVSSEKALKCWGWNDQGQLGYGDTVTRGDESGEMGPSLSIIPLGRGCPLQIAGEESMTDNRMHMYILSFSIVGGILLIACLAIAYTSKKLGENLPKEAQEQGEAPAIENEQIARALKRSSTEQGCTKKVQRWCAAYCCRAGRVPTSWVI